MLHIAPRVRPRDEAVEHVVHYDDVEDPADKASHQEPAHVLKLLAQVVLAADGLSDEGQHGKGCQADDPADQDLDDPIHLA